MNFLAYFCLVASAVLVVQGNIDANTSVDPKLSEGFINATQILSYSKSKIMDGVLAAKKILAKNPEGARKLTQQAALDGQLIAFNGGSTFIKVLGEALRLSNGGARQGLLSAIKYIQKGGLALLDTIKSGGSLFNDGSEVGGRAANESLSIYHLAVETGFSAIFYNLKISSNEVLQAIKDAQSSPIQLQIENPKCGVAAKGDPECSDVLKDINQVANNALRNGANPALVEELKKIVKCALDSLIQVIAEAKTMLADTKAIAEIDTFAATTMVPTAAEALKKRINQVFAQIYLGFGDVYVRSGGQSDKEVESGFSVLEKGNVIIIDIVKFCEQIEVNGLENGGEASMLAFESVAKSINFAKLVFIQSLVECANAVFSLL